MNKAPNGAPRGPVVLPNDPYQRRLAERRQTIAAFRTTANAQRTRAERIADGLAEFFGSIFFIILHVLWFVIWIVWNVDWSQFGLSGIPGLAPFDPFPFGLLTMIVSLEAIFLSAFVLLSQNRSAEIADLRSELELQLNIVLEEKTTALIRAVHTLSSRMGISDDLDPELLDLTKPLDLVAVEQATRAETVRRPARAQVVDVTVTQVRRALTGGNWDEAVRLIEAMKPADQADVFEELQLEQQAELLPRLAVEDSADILEEIDDEMAADLAERLNVEVLADILDEMEPDEAADVLGDLEPQNRAAALAAMSPDDAEEVKPLLIHPDESAGGLMTSEFLALRRRMTAEEALEVVRRWAPDNEALYTLFVVDREGTLVGVLSLRRLVTADPGAALTDIMDPDVISVTADMPPEQCSQLMAHYDLLALPVVDKDHKLLGVITVDDLLDEE